MLISEVTNRRPTRLRMGIAKLLAAAQQMSDWRDWYVRHQHLIEELFGEDAALFRSLLSATSQASNVSSNVGLALKAYQQFKRGEQFTGYLPAVIANLNRIRAAQQLSGAKISEFGGAMHDDANRIAVDRHIGELFYGTTKLSRAQIEKAKQTILKIAQKLNWPPREVQATLWAYNLVRRGEVPISYMDRLLVLSDRIRHIRQALRQIDGRSDAA